MELLKSRSETKPFLQKETPSPIRRSARRPADLAMRERRDAIPASGCAQPANRLARHITMRGPSESPAKPRGAREILADSITSIVRRAARSDRFALRFATVRRPAL